MSLYVQHAVYTIPAAMGALLTFIAFWRSKPPVPPAPSAYRDPIPLFRGLKQVVTTPPFLLLLGVWGCSSGLFNALLTLLAQILCPFGYSDVSKCDLHCEFKGMLNTFFCRVRVVCGVH